MSGRRALEFGLLALFLAVAAVVLAAVFVPKHVEENLVIPTDEPTSPTVVEDDPDFCADWVGQNSLTMAERVSIAPFTIVPTQMPTQALADLSLEVHTLTVAGDPAAAEAAARFDVMARDWCAGEV